MGNSFQIRQLVQAPRAVVYEAWSNLETARKWSCPEGVELPVFEADLRVGGHYNLTMRVPNGTPDGMSMSAEGTYREIIPNEKIVYTWIWQTPETEENLVVVEFKDQGANTEITLSVSGFSDPDEVDSNRGGWTSSLSKLAKRFA